SDPTVEQDGRPHAWRGVEAAKDVGGRKSAEEHYFRREKQPDVDLRVPETGVRPCGDCIWNLHSLGYTSAGCSTALRRLRSVGSTGSFCIVKSRSRPGRLYS